MRSIPDNRVLNEVNESALTLHVIIRRIINFQSVYQRQRRTVDMGIGFLNP
jgi:hypothetical protein